MAGETSRSEAEEARRAAERRLTEMKARRPRVSQLRSALSEILEENHFSVRLSRALDMKDDRRDSQ